MKHRTARGLRAVALAPVVSAAMLGVATAVASGGIGVVAVRVGFLAAAAAIVAGALRWSVAPTCSPATVAGLVALWVLSLHGAAAVGGPSVPLVTLALGVAVVLGRLARQDAPVPVADDTTGVPLTSRPTAELCRLWAETGVQLVRSSTTDHIARLGEVREIVLAELERRHPTGVQRWLASSPPATSNPLPYVEEHEPPHQAA